MSNGSPHVTHTEIITVEPTYVWHLTPMRWWWFSFSGDFCKSSKVVKPSSANFLAAAGLTNIIQTEIDKKENLSEYNHCRDRWLQLQLLYYEANMCVDYTVSVQSTAPDAAYWALAHPTPVTLVRKVMAWFSSLLRIWSNKSRWILRQQRNHSWALTTYVQYM